MSADLQRARTVLICALHARQRARPQKFQDRHDVKRASGNEVERERRRSRFGAPQAQARRREAVSTEEQRVEPANAPEAAGERNLGYRQRRFGEQALGGEQAVRLRQVDRRGAEHVACDAAKVAPGDAEVAREIVEPLLFERARLDARQRLRGEPLLLVDRRGAGRLLRTADETRPKSRLLRRRRRREKAPIGALGRPRRADAPAVYAGRRDARVERPVEAGVLGLHSGVQSLIVEHGREYAAPGVARLAGIGHALWLPAWGCADYACPPAWLQCARWEVLPPTDPAAKR